MRLGGDILKLKGLARSNIQKHFFYAPLHPNCGNRDGTLGKVGSADAIEAIQIA